MARPRRRRWPAAVLLVCGAVAAALGITGGLWRLAGGPGLLPSSLPLIGMVWHGPLLVCGFFGLLIALERALAHGARWALAAPSLAALGSLGLLLAGAWAPWLYVAASAGLLAVSAALCRRQVALFMHLLLAASGCWGVGNLLWAGGAGVLAAVPWWITFLVLTIAAERIELSRLMPPPTRLAQGTLGLVLLLLTLALLAGLPHIAWWLAPHLFGTSLLTLALWLLRHDIARRMADQTGLPRYIACCLLSGHAWLALGGALMAVHGLTPGSPSFDAALHALFVGFALGMVFGHAPIVAPALLRVSLPWHPLLPVPALLLHASLLLRVIGDASGERAWVRAGAQGTAATLVAFVALALVLVLRGKFLTRFKEHTTGGV